MLVAVNPYEVLPIYRNTEIVEYRERKIGELPPHIFAIGDSSFNEMKKFRKNQCIVIRYNFEYIYRFYIPIQIFFLVGKAAREKLKVRN